VRNSGTESRRPEVKFQVVIAPVHRLQIVAVNTELKVLHKGYAQKSSFIYSDPDSIRSVDIRIQEGHIGPPKNGMIKNFFCIAIWED
jgi:hypothetical protein